MTHINVNKKQLDKLREQGFFDIELKTEYETRRMQRLQPKTSLILYNSKKLVIQASDEIKKQVEHTLKDLAIGKKLTKQEVQKIILTGTTIGSDETLKGDTFGGLVVAAVRVDDKTRESLELLGVQDSKKIKDEKIAGFSEEIKRIVGKENYAIKNVKPKEYNKHDSQDLLNALHTQVALELGEGTHIVDQYPGCKVGDIKEFKAESKYPSVAAASIIARDAALKQLGTLSNELGIDIPKGSTHVKEALEYLKRSKRNPEEFVKMHFRNVKEIFS